jgi:outer membrane protein assembly factor BamB
MMKNLSIVFLAAILLTTISCSSLKSLLPEAPKKESAFFKAAWSKNLDQVSDSGNLPIALNSPAIFDGIVYVGDGAGYMNAYELENGKSVWRVYDGATYHSTPVIYKNWVIYGTIGGRVIARSLKNGDEVAYNVDLGSPIETAGTIYKGKIFFHLRNHQIFCLDIETGKIIWGFKKSVSYVTTLQRASQPVIYNNKVFVGFADGTFGALSVEEGVLIYESKLSTASKFLDVDTTPVIVDNKIVVGPQGSPVVLLDPNTGKILRRAEFTSLRSPLVLNDQLVFGTTNGELVWSDKNLNILKRIKISKNSLSSLALFKDKIIAGSFNGDVFAFDLKNFSVADKFEYGHAYSAIFSDLVSLENHLIVLSSRNRLFTFY